MFYLTRARDYPAASAEDVEVVESTESVNVHLIIFSLTSQAKQEAVKLLGSL